MNKQRFLTELQRLLIFMTEADRKLTVDQYAAMFAEAGEEGEDALIEQLGSPTKVAISLSRGYEPGRLSTETRQREALKKAEAAAKAARLSHLSDDSYTPGGWTDDAENDPVSIILNSLDEPAEPDAPKPFPARTAAVSAEDNASDEDEEDEAADETRPSRGVRTGAPVSRGTGIALLTLILLVLGVPLAALTLVIALVWLIPAAIGLGASLLCAIGALWCLSYIADALLVFGLGFVVLAAALLLLWCGIWLDVRLVGFYVQGVQALCDKLLGKKVLL